jgi:hypothetical protein
MRMPPLYPVWLKAHVVSITNGSSSSSSSSSSSKSISGKHSTTAARLTHAAVPPFRCCGYQSLSAQILQPMTGVLNLTLMGTAQNPRRCFLMTWRERAAECCRPPATSAATETRRLASQPVFGGVSFFCFQKVWAIGALIISHLFLRVCFRLQ